MFVITTYLYCYNKCSTIEPTKITKVRLVNEPINNSSLIFYSYHYSAASKKVFTVTDDELRWVNS